MTWLGTSRCCLRCARRPRFAIARRAVLAGGTVALLEGELGAVAVPCRRGDAHRLVHILA
ncbi:hypothetical protein LP419_39205 [Massilia sp. H-1]|nr:hypothetical protein LP419_39205 [Massilia sp. H-1]